MTLLIDAWLERHRRPFLYERKQLPAAYRRAQSSSRCFALSRLSD